jgi:hypothetical protein
MFAKACLAPPTDTVILKGINGPSIGNAFECHLRRVRETRSPKGKFIFTQKAPILAQFSRSCVSLNAHISNARSPTSLGPYFNSASDREISLLRYGHFGAKGQIFIFVLVKLGNFASRKSRLDPRCWMISLNHSTGGGVLGENDTKRLAIGSVTVNIDR